MRKEIGSFYEINKLEKEEKTENNVYQWLRNCVEPKHLNLVCSGREAIEAVILDIQKKRKDSKKICLLPQYTCDTVIIPFQKHGWKIYFYPVNRSLLIGEKEFKDLLEYIKPSVLLMHSYYGIDTLYNVREIIQEWQKKEGLIFIEDFTQSIQLLERREKIADYYVGSLRKWFSIPDGGFFTSDCIISMKDLKEKIEFVQKKKKAQELKGLYLQGFSGIEKEEILILNRAAEDYLYENDNICRISKYSYEKLLKIDYQEALCQRKQNGQFLYERIKDLKEVESLFCVEEAPLYFPIYAAKREELQSYLRENNIFVPILWPMPKEVQSVCAGDIKYIFQHLLALPCDQRYGEEDMEMIGRYLLEYEKRNKDGKCSYYAGKSEF